MKFKVILPFKVTLPKLLCRSSLRPRGCLAASRLFIFVFTFVLPLTFSETTAFACTEFRLQAKDDSILIARTMEYDSEMHSNLRSSNRNRKFTFTAPNEKPGLSWTAKYGFVFFDAFDFDIAVDGINEKGLSFGALYLPELAEYQTVPKNQNKNALSYVHIGDWILSNFATVDEVKTALQKIYVFQEYVPGFGKKIFPLHFSIYDATGKGLVVEYINGQLNMHENKIGILTNSPSYDWHLTNLNNYVHLTPFNPPKFSFNSVSFAATGEGFGMVGLPGDHSPISRFVKMATFVRVSMPAKDSLDAVNLASHIINNVDIPRGVIRVPSVHDPHTGDTIMETTQWTTFKDLTHKAVYFRTYEDLALRSVLLEKIDFSENAPRFKMSLAHKEEIHDLTDEFLKSKQVLDLE